MLGRVIRYKIEISSSVNNGFVVKIGCATLVYASSKDLLKGLEKYLSDPEKWEKEYNKMGGGDQPEQPICDATPPPPQTSDQGR